MASKSIGLLLVFLAGALSAYGQSDEVASIPARGFHPAHTYSISDIEAINQATGALSLHIPIAQLPPGPAGFSAGLSLVYNSKYWETYPAAGGGGGTDYWLVRSGGGAWGLAIAPALELVYVDDPTYCVNGEPVIRLQILDPDGSSHLLLLRGTASDRGTYCLNGLNLTVPTFWYSKDGSFLQVELDPATPDWPNSWRLRRNDGTSVRYDATAEKTYLRDRNGNEVTILSGFLDSEHVFTEMEDTFGRKIRMDDTLSPPGPSGPQELVQTIVTQVGHDGNSQIPLTWTITYSSFPAITAPSTYECFENELHTFWDDPCTFADIFAKPPLITSLQLPNGLQYQFQYNARYRELSRLTLPTGATVDYGYWGDSVISPLRYYRILANPLTGKTVTHDGGTTESWTYANSDDGNAFTETRTWRTATAPDGGTTRYDFYGLSYYFVPNLLGGIIQKITPPDGSILQREWAFNYPYPFTPGGTINPWIRTECGTQVNSLGAPVSTSMRVHTSDKNGNITSTAEHDWTAPAATCVPESSGLLLRKTLLTYVNGAQDSTYTGEDPNAYSHTALTSPRNLVASRETQNASATVLTRSEFSYQESTPARMVGNLVRQYDWDNTRPNPDPNDNQISPGTPLNDSIAVKREYAYTARGNLLTETDPNANPVTYSYAAIPNCPNLAADATDLYRTGMQRGGVTSVLQQWTYTYKCVSGLPEQVTDPNGLATATTYDRYGRPTEVTEGTLRTTRHTYPADGVANLWVVTTTDVSANGDQRNVSVSRFDQLGRPRLTQQLEQMTTAQVAAADESLGIKTETKYKFLSGINAVLVSNPYRETDPNAPTRGWTATRRDTAGRVCTVETFDGAAEPALAQNCAPTSGATGRTGYSFDATATFAEQTITETTPDPSGAVRKLQSDVLGRLLTVIEDPSGENYTTTYAYNLRDNLTGVTQGATARSFVNSSLNRLLTATNPESGTTSYSYDLAGNLLTRTSGGVVRCNGTWSGAACLTAGPDAGYDDLNRLRKTTYSDATPTVTYTYDTAQATEKPASCAADNGPKGRLAKVSSSTFSTYYFYNQLGHTTCSRQRVQTYDPFDFLYTNTPQGEWATVKYPSGRTLNTAFDDAGRPLSLAGNSPYASALKYAAHGAIGQVTLGNGTVETTSYNGRLQLTDLKLGSSPGQGGAGTSDRWWLENCYNDSDPCVGSGPANNGNVRYQRLTVLNGAPVKTVYRYDGLNRLTLANETPTSPTNPLCPDAASHWCQQYDYDARGNRRVEAESYLGFVLGRPDTFGADNRIADAGFAYDARGNLTLLPTGERYVYDGENRQVVYCASFVTEPDCGNPAVTIGKTFYYYDGEGRRVGKVNGAVTEAYVYDAQGRLAAEYGGAAVETATHYLTADHLGSTRVITDPSKAVLQCKDYLPFGDEILASTQNARNSIACYSAETGLRQKFTGKERDGESRLDFFEARYYSWAQGRFTSPDEPLVDQQGEDPQSWNLYGYGRNNPLVNSDPTGNKCITTDDGSQVDDMKGGGCDAAGVDPSGRIEPQNVDVEEIGPPSPLLLAVAQGAQRTKPVVDALAIATTAFVGGAMIGSAIPVGIETVGLNSPWLLGWGVRGATISGMAGANLPYAFKTIDKFQSGVATSIKSIDLTRATNLDPAKLLSLINRYVNTLSKFPGARYGEFRVGEAARGPAIQQRVLEIVIPPGATPAQMQAIQTATTQALRQGVEIRTVVMK